MKKRISCLISIILSLTLIMGMSVVSFASDFYENDPRKNPDAMKDIVVDENAIFGFSPDPESTRLGEYAAYDFSDPVFVKQAVENRADYHKRNAQLYNLMNSLFDAGKSTEEVARAVSKRRNEIRIESYKDNPEGLAKLKKSNLETYGNEEGPTADSLFKKYGSWEVVLQKAFSTNPGMDACLGMYDIYYKDYVRLGIVDINESSVISYKVKSTDNLSKIANKYFGNTEAWKQIYNENIDQISDPNIIYEGMVLTIVLD